METNSETEPTRLYARPFTLTRSEDDFTEEFNFMVTVYRIGLLTLHCRIFEIFAVREGIRHEMCADIKMVGYDYTDDMDMEKLADSAINVLMCSYHRFNRA